MFDREADLNFIIEVKLMDKGNLESADAIIARDTNIFIADTLSLQNKNQLEALNIEYLELKNNPNCMLDFKNILLRLDIPCLVG